ncbi:homeobox protein EMX1-like isoform X2 [Tachyglossus aculeatus]|uniref:homeobox protein EMX1-like isoform X2 n=1 Tax=Tachyglossus aculeatus TaxID=9261 RepID=UPI0018F4B752|nr:homeobox protein EMX1-like isoform X2 [Tachyglossus aculeatus]
MLQPATKRCFTIESLVAKEGGGAQHVAGPGALGYPASVGTAAPTFAPGGFPGPGRPLYPGPELAFPDALGPPPLAVHPVHQLGATPLQPPPSFFGAQPRDPLNFYPWVLRNRFFGHRFQGDRQGLFGGNYPRCRCRLNLPSRRHPRPPGSPLEAGTEEARALRMPCSFMDLSPANRRESARPSHPRSCCAWSGLSRRTTTWWERSVNSWPAVSASPRRR